MTDTHKRQMNQASVPQNENADIAKLSTIGMRIRKAVADGYQVTEGNNNYDGTTSYSSPNYGNTFESRRVPFPSHLEHPPSLTNVGSTYQSGGSSMAEWDSRYQVNNAPLQTLSEPGKLKRKFNDDYEEQASAPTVVDLNAYQSKYGQLSFTEEF
ncbi:uncharacterized protein RJT20DRAFT_126569 [Scheffersomyces xylosifermentans]|uniref:uncharacterized protein n=1 Tax=Scheffersomyces xylosifermentans TaxID=1304137 RepID=UPI00315C75CA